MVAIGLGAGPGFLFGFIGPALQSELGVSRSGLGLLVGLFFGATGAASILAARSGAALGARRCLLASLLCVALVGVVIGTWHSYAVLAVGALVGGASYAFGNVGTNMAVAAAAPARRSGLMLTIKTAGVPLVASILAFASGLAGSAHWPLVAWGLSLACLITAVFTLRLLPPLDWGRRRDRREPPLQKAFWLLPVAAFLFICGSQPLQSFLVVYLHDDDQMDSAGAGTVAAVIQVVGIAAMIGAAHWADLLGGPRRAAFVAALCLVAALGITVLVGAGRFWVGLGLVGAAIGLSGNLATAGLTHAVVVDRAPASVGRASGIALVGYYLGALVAPVGFGLLVDLTGSYVVAWLSCAVVLCLAALSYWGAQVAMPVARSSSTAG